MADYREGLLCAAVAEMHAINARIEGMRAANIARDTRGEAPAYGEKDFIEAANELSGWANHMRGIYA